MKIIHVPYGFYPDRVGGTEVYVEQLARALNRLGTNSVIAAPGIRDDNYMHESLIVHRFATQGRPNNIHDLYGRGDPAAERGFAGVLGNQQPDLVHFHAFSPAVSTRLVQRTQELRIPRVFTYHTPAVSCPRQSLMRWGDTVCDGKLRLRTCSACRLQSLRVPRPAALPLALVPTSLGRMMTETDHQSRVHTAIGMTALVSRRHAAVHSYLAGMDRIVVLSSWSLDVLLLNGIPRDRIVVSPHGIDDASATAPRTFPPDYEPVQLALIARADPIKGVHTVLKAMWRVPDLPLQLMLILRAQAGHGEKYIQHLRSLGDRDSRVSIDLNAGASVRNARLSQAHAVVVPSECLETGPLVVLEAFARGLPVLGSRLGGIAELVEHGRNGILVEPGSISAWVRTLRDISDGRLLEALRSGVSPPRTMADVATDMKTLYEDLLGKTC